MRALVAFFEPGGVDDGEAQIGEFCVAFAPIARHARRVVDQRQLPTDQPIEQRRFADVRPADDRDFGGHGRMAFYLAGEFDATRPSSVSAFCLTVSGASTSETTSSSHLPAPA